MKNNYSWVSKVSTLGPAKTNSDYAAKEFMARQGISGEPILARTAEESFEMLLDQRVEACVVCCLYPDIHKLYIPNLQAVTVCDVFINNARMGLYRNGKVRDLVTVAAPITSTVFVKDDPFKIVIANSNAQAAALCAAGEVDGAVATTDSAVDHDLVLMRDFGVFAVPYAVFCRKGLER